MESIYHSDYPKDRCTIIAVNDGSLDDTWYWIKRAGKCFPKNIECIKLPVNQEKREALTAGFRKNNTEIIVTVDSDPIVERQTLRQLLSPFIHDKKIGGVAGNVRVLNTKEGLIPKMMNVIFAFNFKFIQSGQSSVGSVMCSPDALAAYKRSVLERNLKAWKTQTCLGQPAKIGEDRALTNMILRCGHHVVFQADEIVHRTYRRIYSPYRKC